MEIAQGVARTLVNPLPAVSKKHFSARESKPLKQSPFRDVASDETLQASCLQRLAFQQP
jgi:hypothetical protein